MKFPVDFRLQDNFFTLETYEYLAFIIRNTFSSGIFSTPYARKDPTVRPYKNDYTTGWSYLGIHNHSNYWNMPGMGKLIVNINGYILETRHNDYIITKKDSNGNYIDNPPPQSPNYSINQMRDLFRRYLNRSLTNDEKKLFRWDLTYLEVFFIRLDSPDDNLQDLFKSFRHGLPRVTVAQVDELYNQLSDRGLKARFENIAKVPVFVDRNGNVWALFWTITTQPLEQFSGALWNDIVKEYDLEEYKYETDFYSPRKKFLFKNLNVLDQIITSIPGLTPNKEIWQLRVPDSDVTLTSPDGKPLNYYHRIYKYVGSDAVNIAVWPFGYNDPNLFVAFNNRDDIRFNVSFMIPLELILRTPLETWNPYNLQFSPQVQGNGTQSNPWTSVCKRGRYYLTPAEFYNGTSTSSTVADTVSGARYVKDPNGNIRAVMPSGIWITLPEIKDVGKIRIRFPVAPDAIEYSSFGKLIDRVEKNLEKLTALFINHEIKLKSMEDDIKSKYYTVGITYVDHELRLHKTEKTINLFTKNRWEYSLQITQDTIDTPYTIQLDKNQYPLSEKLKRIIFVNGLKLSAEKNEYEIDFKNNAVTIKYPEQLRNGDIIEIYQF